MDGLRTDIIIIKILKDGNIYTFLLEASGLKTERLAGKIQVKNADYYHIIGSNEFENIDFSKIIEIFVTLVSDISEFKKVNFYTLKLEF